MSAPGVPLRTRRTGRYTRGHGCGSSFLPSPPACLPLRCRAATVGTTCGVRHSGSECGSEAEASVRRYRSRAAWRLGLRSAAQAALVGAFSLIVGVLVLGGWLTTLSPAERDGITQDPGVKSAYYTEIIVGSAAVLIGFTSLFWSVIILDRRCVTGKAYRPGETGRVARRGQERSMRKPFLTPSRCRYPSRHLQRRRRTRPVLRLVPWKVSTLALRIVASFPAAPCVACQ